MKTGAEWVREYPNLEILDADGWNEYGNGPYPTRSSYHTLPISREEFERRVMHCTIQCKGSITKALVHE